jgi:DNA-binding HxlR family transcriptional regulator
MKWEEIGKVRCSVARTLSVVGDRWTLLILRDAFLGIRRFEVFQRNLGLTRHLLAERLRKLVDNGILDRVSYQEKPSRFEYRLTQKGIDLYPILLSLVRWGDEWMTGDDVPPMVYEHRPCGHVGLPALHCPACGEPVDPREITPRFQPSVTERSADGD